MVSVTKRESDNKTQVIDGIVALIEKGMLLNATDIHIEPQDQKIIVRYRVGNGLQLGTKLPIGLINDLLGTCKNIAGLDLDDEVRSQEGNFTINIGGQTQTIRAQTIPLIVGEKIVLHIHSNSPKYQTLESLGYWGQNLDTLSSILSKLRGMIVIAGSGRNANSLTLYNIANLLNRPPLKIGTIEDPIYSKIDHVTQLEVNSFGTPFIKELGILEKQDINVILMSNLPNQQVAKIALRYAKNRMICAGLYSVNAVTALHQLLKMDTQVELLMARLEAVVGQTIFRKLCENCRQLLSINLKQKKQISKLMGDSSFKQINQLEIKAVKNKLGIVDKKLLSTPSSINYLWFANSHGCSECQHTGYKNHVMLAEIFNLTDEKIKSKLCQTNVRRATIEKVAYDSGMIPQTIDGLIKCLRGLVDFHDLIAFAKISQIR
jgi:type IV pilus assembly protein PilB